MQDHWTDWWTDGYLECKEWLREWGEINSRAMSRTVENRHILPGEYRNKKKGNDQSDWWILDDMVGGKNMDSFARAEVALIVKEKQINKIYKKWKVCKRKKLMVNIEEGNEKEEYLIIIAYHLNEDDKKEKNKNVFKNCSK